jgi:hypothetical protein
MLLDGRIIYRLGSQLNPFILGGLGPLGDPGAPILLITDKQQERFSEKHLLHLGLLKIKRKLGPLASLISYVAPWTPLLGPLGVLDTPVNFEKS